MFYEVYIDIFFAVNAMLDFFIIETARKIQRYKSTNIRVVIASMAGSAVLCVFLCVPVRKYMLVRLLFYGGAYGSMAAIAFPQNKRMGRIKAVFTLYVISLLVNGIYQWLSWNIEHSFQLLAAGTGIYLLIGGACFWYRKSQESQRHIFDVRIRFQGQDIYVKGLWDTGNRLCSPYDGKGVSVIDYESIQGFISKDIQKCVESGINTADLEALETKIFLIPYQSVGCAHGLMPVLSAENMVVEREGEEIEYRNPLLGISKSPVSKGNLFQIILTTDGG